MHSKPIALVFCGGSGKRLRPLTYLIRKEMLPIGRQRKPLLEYIVNHVRREGIWDIVFLGSSKQGDDIANYFGDGSRFGVRIRHHPDPEGCRGTGHALLAAIKSLDLSDRQLLLYYGDMLTDVSLRDVIANHQAQCHSATLVLSKSYILPKGVATTDRKGIVKSLREKPKWEGPGKIGMGILCIDASSLVRTIGGIPSAQEIVRSNQYQDVMRDLVPRLVNAGSVGSHTFDDPWLDIGSFESYEKVCEDTDWIVKPASTLPQSHGRMRVFLSYHRTKASSAIVEGIVGPCVEAAGIAVTYGGHLDENEPALGAPTRQAQDAIDQVDCLLAVVVRDQRHARPSDYIQQEVAYAHGRGQSLCLFVDRDLKIPAPWNQSYTFKKFDKTDTGRLMVAVMQALRDRGDRRRPSATRASTTGFGVRPPRTATRPPVPDERPRARDRRPDPG